MIPLVFFGWQSAVYYKDNRQDTGLFKTLRLYIIWNKGKACRKVGAQRSKKEKFYSIPVVNL